jgi:site-specific DNA recombinase
VRDILLKRIRAIPVSEEKTQNKKLKVAAYCRVSTKEECQLSSYEIQKDYFADLIKNNPNWEFEGIYGDHGKSGLHIDERGGLKELIHKALEGEINLILTKSISRVSRNILDTLMIIKRLKERDVNMYFEKENLNTIDANAELMISILGSLAQEESRNMSENIKWGYRRRFKKGVTLSKYKNFMGYTCVNDELVVVP